jgi:hypothetical protein
MEQTKRCCPTHGIPLARRYRTETTDANKVRKVPEFYCRVCAMKQSLATYKERAIKIEKMKQGL